MKVERARARPSGCRWEVVDGPPEWIGTHVEFDLPQDGDFTIVLFKHEGWARAGRVHAPLQHQVGDLPDEPEVAGRDRGGGAVAPRRARGLPGLISVSPDIMSVIGDVGKRVSAGRGLF